MKALFIRCNGKLTPDMLVGGLIDMGVPPAYLRTKLEAAGVSSDFIESSNLDAKVSAYLSVHFPWRRGLQKLPGRRKKF